MATLFRKQKGKKRKLKDELLAVENGENASSKFRELREKLPTVHKPDEEFPLTAKKTVKALPLSASFADLGLSEALVQTCHQLGFKRPTAVQRAVIPFLLEDPSSHVLALASTGSGKTAAFVLPILHRLSLDPYGIFAVVLTPTRELAQQIHQQVLALGGGANNVQSALAVGGLDAVAQSCQLDRLPHFCIATPGRLAELLRGAKPPRIKNIRFMVLDEADRLLASNSGFERDVAELLLHCTTNSTRTRIVDNDGSTPSSNAVGPASIGSRVGCQTLLFSATTTPSLEKFVELADAGRRPVQQFFIQENDGVSNHKGNTGEKNNLKSSDVVDDEDEELGSGSESDSNDEKQAAVVKKTKVAPKIPEGLKQEYIFMPSRVRDAYLLAILRTLLENGGRRSSSNRSKALSGNDDEEEEEGPPKARSAVAFVSTCERAALVSGILSQVGVENVALHSLLSQNRRLASLGTFKSQQVPVLVATDVASRGLDIPTVDLVINVELPRNAISYVHRVGRTARAGRRGRAISLVAEQDVALVHAAEAVSGRPLEKCNDISDETAIQMLGPVTKAARLTKMKLMDIGFDELVRKHKERKQRDRKDRERIARSLQKTMKEQQQQQNKK